MQGAGGIDGKKMGVMDSRAGDFTRQLLMVAKIDHVTCARTQEIYCRGILTRRGLDRLVDPWAVQLACDEVGRQHESDESHDRDNFYDLQLSNPALFEDGAPYREHVEDGCSSSIKFYGFGEKTRVGSADYAAPSVAWGKAVGRLAALAENITRLVVPSPGRLSISNLPP